MSKLAMLSGMNGVAAAGVASVAAVGVYVSGVLAPEPVVPDPPKVEVAQPVAPAVEQEQPLAAPPTPEDVAQEPEAVPAPAVQEVTAPPVEAEPEPAPQEEIAALVPSEPAVEATPEPAPQAEPEAAAQAEPEQASIEAPALIAPSFDVVRVEPNGSTLVAGNAQPGAEVVLLLDGTELERSMSDGQGRFVAFLELGVSQGPRVLSLQSLVDGTVVMSEGEVIIAPSEAVMAALQPDPTPEPVVEPAPQPVPDTAAAPVAEPAQQPAPETAPEPAPVAAADPAPQEPEAPASDPVLAESAAPETVVAVAPAPEATPEPAAEAEEPQPTAQAAAPQTDAVEPQTNIAAAAPQAAPAPAPAPQAQDPVVETAPAPEAPSLPQPNAVASAPAAPTAVPEPVTDVPAVRQAAAAPTVILSTRDGVKILQQPVSPDAQPAIRADLELGAISYDAQGNVSVTGRAQPGALLRLYVDNALVVSTQATQAGTWQTDLPAVTPGVYTLRVDQIGAGGGVSSRVDSPFQREDPEVLIAASQPEEGSAQSPVRAITVQPGNTLWAIARDRYGEGTAFVKVFEANKGAILNPDLIFPGQVFDLPD